MKDSSDGREIGAQGSDIIEQIRVAAESHVGQVPSSSEAVQQ